MRMWEIREGYNGSYGDRYGNRYGDRYGDRDPYMGERDEAEEAYEAGRKKGYEEAMREMGSMGERRNSRGRYM